MTCEQSLNLVYILHIGIWTSCVIILILLQKRNRQWQKLCGLYRGEVGRVVDVNLELRQLLNKAMLERDAWRNERTGHEKST